MTRESYEGLDERKRRRRDGKGERSMGKEGNEKEKKIWEKKES